MINISLTAQNHQSEIIVETGENVDSKLLKSLWEKGDDGNQHFLLVPQNFSFLLILTLSFAKDNNFFRQG